MELQGLRVVVTGASSGLGKAIAMAFAEQQCQVAVLSNQAEELERTSLQLQSITSNVLSCVGDLCDVEFLERFSRQVIDRFGWVDILVNNAGIILPEKLGTSDIRNWQQVLGVNLTAPFVLTNHFAPGMNQKSASPLIVNVASISGLMGSPYCASYVASKFGLVGLTEAINEEFRMHGRIRAVAICPGPIDTPSWGPLKGWAGIVPSPDEKMLEPKMIADMIIQLAKMSDTVDVSRVMLKARKDIRLPDSVHAQTESQLAAGVA